MENKFGIMICKGALIVGSLIAFSCERSLVVTPNENLPQETARIADMATYKGILQFKDLEEFNKSALVLSDLNSEDRRYLENTKNYSSLKTVLENVKILKKKLNENSKEYFSIDDNGILNFDFFSFNVANVINEKGLVIIGNELFKFHNNGIERKRIEKIDNDVQLLTSGISTSLPSNVRYTKVNFLTSASNKSARVGEGTYSSTSAFQSDGNAYMKYAVKGTLRLWYIGYEYEACSSGAGSIHYENGIPMCEGGYWYYEQSPTLTFGVSASAEALQRDDFVYPGQIKQSELPVSVQFSTGQLDMSNNYYAAVGTGTDLSYNSVAQASGAYVTKDIYYNNNMPKNQYGNFERYWVGGRMSYQAISNPGAPFGLSRLITSQITSYY